MKFGALQRRVKRCEQVMAVRIGETQDSWSLLSQVWRQGWSPLRIVVVGLAGGFIAGKLEIPGKVNASGWLKMAGSVSSLFASAQAALATIVAAQAAETAEDATDEVDGAVRQPAPVRPAAAPTPEPELREPRPAEAATELSER